MSYIIINELTVRASDVQAFETNFEASMRGTLGDVAGLVAARLLAPRTPERGYLSMLEFTDRDAYEAYLSSAAFTAAHRWPDHAPFTAAKLAEFSQLVDLEPNT